MSKKRIITMFASLCIIILLCVLGGAVFVIRDIDVVFSGNKPEGIDDAELIRKANIEYGKSIFSISESKVVTNIETNYPDIKVRGIERVFPNKIILKLAERVPVAAIKFADKQEYLILDSNMCAMEKVGAASEKLNGLCMVRGFELSGNTDIYLGKQLPASYGIEAVVVQQIMAGLSESIDAGELTRFLGEIYFVDGYPLVSIRTRYGESGYGVTIRLDFSALDKDKYEVYNLIKGAYRFYLNDESMSDPQNKSEGYILYDKTNNQFFYKKNDTN